VDIADFLSSVDLVDVLVALFLFGMFVLGYVQGTIRRVVGILTMTFSFFLAATLQVPLGEFLASHWVQYPAPYSFMLAFLTIFAASVIAFSLVVQGTYKKVEIFARHPVLDEVIGGMLGVLQGLLLLLFLLIAMDGYFLLRTAPDPDELPFLRDFWTAIDGSAFGGLLHDNVIPPFVALFSIVLPESMRSLYGVQ